MSFLTPPVCISAYVAAGIANSNPMKTGFQAVPLAVVAFIVPFAFIYSPALLLVGTTQNIVLTVLSALLGVVILSIAFEGYFLARISLVTRVVLAGCGVLLLMPNPILRLIGLVAVIIIVVAEYLLKRARLKETVSL